MKQKTKLSLIEENHDEILNSFNCNKEEIKRSLEDMFSAWLANPFHIDYSKNDRQSFFELYNALLRQVDLMEYMPSVKKELAEIKEMRKAV